MVTLTEFLLLRIAEDEAVAVECRKLDADVGSLSTWVEVGSDEVDAAVALGDRFNPTRVLAECEAKRLIVEDRMIWESDHTQRLLAAVYGGHPDYDEAWRP